MLFGLDAEAENGLTGGLGMAEKLGRTKTPSGAKDRGASKDAGSYSSLPFQYHSAKQNPLSID